MDSTEKRTPRSLPELAESINSEHRQAAAAVRSHLDHAREAGLLLIEAKSQCKHGTWDAWLADNFEGSARTARDYMLVVKRWDVIEPNWQCAADLSLREALRMAAGPSGPDDWFTPAAIADAARKVLGTIDVDPASCEAANEVIRAEKFYTVEDDGLAQDWSGTVWINPPYGRGVFEQFASKLLDCIDSGSVADAILLSNSITETAIGQRLLRRADATCFPAGRVPFWNPDRGSNPERGCGSPKQSQVFFYFGHDPRRFAEIFRDIGTCTVEWQRMLDDTKAGRFDCDGKGQVSEVTAAK